MLQLGTVARTLLDTVNTAKVMKKYIIGLT